MNLRLCKAFEREKFSSVFSCFPDLPNASSVGSLNHATLPNCVRRSVVCIPNRSTFRAFRSLCVSLCLLARLYTAIHRPLSTDSLACCAGALTKQLSDLPLSKTCVAHVPDIVIEYTCIPHTSHGPCCFSPYHQVWGHLVVPDRVRSLWWNMMDTKLEGSHQLRAEPVGKTFPRPNVTLSDFFPVKSDKKKGNNSRNVSPVTSRRNRNTSPAISRRSSVVSWSDSPRDQAVPKSEDAVMEDCTESHQAEINRKIRANDKLRKILTNMPDEHKSLIYGDSLKTKMQSLDDEKVALLAAKRQFLPLQSLIENTRITWSE